MRSISFLITKLKSYESICSLSMTLQSHKMLQLEIKNYCVILYNLEIVATTTPLNVKF